MSKFKTGTRVILNDGCSDAYSSALGRVVDNGGNTPMVILYHQQDMLPRYRLRRWDCKDGRTIFVKDSDLTLVREPQDFTIGKHATLLERYEDVPAGTVGRISKLLGPSNKWVEGNRIELSLDSNKTIKTIIVSDYDLCLEDSDTKLVLEHPPTGPMQPCDLYVEDRVRFRNGSEGSYCISNLNLSGSAAIVNEEGNYISTDCSLSNLELVSPSFPLLKGEKVVCTGIGNYSEEGKIGEIAEVDRYTTLPYFVQFDDADTGPYWLTAMGVRKLDTVQEKEPEETIKEDGYGFSKEVTVFTR